MKRQIRYGAFETNSSSTHAICISKKSLDLDTLPDYVFFYRGNFGWKPCIFTRLEDKASYLYECICGLHFYENYDGYEEWIDFIKNTLGKYNIKCVFYEGEVYDGYVDHVYEAREFVEEVLNDEDMFLRYLFGESKILTGNDNTDEDRVGSQDSDDYDVYYKWN